MFEEMHKKVALITGATSGIGKETALLFAKHGIKVVLAGRNEKAGKELQSEITKSGNEALFVQTDVSNYDSVKNLVEKVQNHFGQIDYAFNNAGVEGKLAPLADIEESEFDEVIKINLKGVWNCLKFQLQAMSARGGSIVNVSTNITKIIIPGTSIYAASKSGVESLTRGAAVEYGRFGIRVNAINPGAVDTPMMRRIIPNEKEVNKLNEDNPLKKIASPQEIAFTALWLCSPMASHINGDTIFIDGGSSLVG